MTNQKSIRHAALTSILAILLCVAMLIGATFAWFTDTAGTTVNRIQSGNLSIEIRNEAGKKIDRLDWVKNDGTVIENQEAILWEPGCTYKLTPFRIVNIGNLALKYKLFVTGLNGNAKLAEALQFTYQIGTESFPISREGHLAAKGKAGDRTEPITILVSMDPSAGNDLMDETLSNVTVTVYATQDTVESDSYDNQYDRLASYEPVRETHTVANWGQDAQNAFASGGTVVLTGYLEGDKTKTGVKDRLTVSSPAILDFQATVHIPGSLQASDNWAALFLEADTTINATPGAGIYCSNKVEEDHPEYIGGPYVANISGEGTVVTVNSGFYYGGRTTFFVQEGTLVVNDGFFQVTPDGTTGDARYTLACDEANYQDGKAGIVVKGGTFVNFDPSDNRAQGEHTNFVADGYRVIPQKQSSGDIWYTVVAK